MPEEEEKKTGIGRKTWIILGIVVLGIIVGGLLLNRGTPTEPAVTLQSVNIEVQAIKERVATEEGKSAIQAEDIADILSDIDTLIERINDVDARADEIATIKAELDALENTVSNLIPYYVQVTRVEDDYVDVTTYKAGDYAIVVTLYGQNLTDVDARYPAVCNISGLWGSTTMFVAVVEPVTEWTLDYAVELKVTGVVEFATAIVSRGQGQSEAEW